MQKYIDAEKLKAEIESRIEETKSMKPSFDQFWAGQISAFKGVIKIINSLQQEPPNDVRAEIKEYYGEELAFDDERTKAAYHFFSAGKAFELREYEEEREKHITDLLANFQKGMNAGYEKAISELKEGKIEYSPVMKEFIDKFISIGDENNFGFGPKIFQQEQPEVDLEKEIMDWSKENVTGVKPIYTADSLIYGLFPKLARHFYDLGRNVRKED